MIMLWLRRRPFLLLLGIAVVVLIFLNVRTADELLSTNSYGVHKQLSNNSYHAERYSSGFNYEKLFFERKQIIEDKCDSIPPSKTASEPAIKSHFIADDKYKLVYCFIEKNGCTFWKRVFQILNGFKNVSDPFDTQAMAAYGGYQTLENMPFHTIHKTLISSKKFMFVRNPYERLLSGYIDKLFSPYAPYWFDLGKFIVDKFRQNRTLASLSCGDDVTFEEFVRYYLHSMETGERADVHFSSNYEFCRPCEIQYDFIAKMENFKEEAMFLLEMFNLTETIKIKDFESETERDAILNAVDWDFYVDRNVNNCTTKSKVLLKNFRKMQIRGIISKGIPFPFPDVSKIEIGDYKKVLLEANAKSGPREKRKLNRKEAFIEAYTSLPRDLFQELQNVLKTDVELFGYETDPDIFKAIKSDTSEYHYFNV